jgi:hypothetical protein
MSSFVPLGSDGISVSALLETLGPAVLSPITEDLNHQLRVRESVLWDQMDPLPIIPGGLLLVVGGSATSPVTAEALAEAALIGYVGAVIKCRTQDLTNAIATAKSAGIALFATSDDVSWGVLDSLLTSAIASNGPDDSSTFGGAEFGDLFALANVIAVSVEAAITIEDAGWRVLAYSNIEGQPIDPVRSDSILGRQVRRLDTYESEYRALARSQEPVRFETYDDILPRVAMPVRAGGRLLGSIWAIDEHGEDGDRIAAVLMQMMPTVALHLLGAAHRSDLERYRRTELLASQLGVPGYQNVDAGASLRRRLPVALLGFGPLDRIDGIVDDLRLTEVAVFNAEAFCRDVSCARVADAIYVLLPSNQFAPSRLSQFARSTMRTLADTARLEFGCAYVEQIQTTDSIGEARKDIGLALRGMNRTNHFDCVNVTGHHQLVVMEELIDYGVAGTRHLIRPVREILEHDRETGSLYAATLLAHLDCGGDVRHAAATLNLHENSHRYRMRRVIEQFDLNLGDPELRLVLWLQLRIALGAAGQ